MGQSERMKGFHPDKASGYKLRTFIVKKTVVGEDKPPSLPQLQTGAVLQKGDELDLCVTHSYTLPHATIKL